MSYRADANLIAAQDLRATRPWPRGLAALLAVLIVGGCYALLRDQLHPPAQPKKGKARSAAPAQPGVTTPTGH